MNNGTSVNDHRRRRDFFRQSRYFADFCDGTCGLCRPRAEPPCKRERVLRYCRCDTTKSPTIRARSGANQRFDFGSAFRNTRTNAGHSGVNGFNGMEVIRTTGTFYPGPPRADKRCYARILYTDIHVHARTRTRVSRSATEIRFTLRRS